MRELDHHNIHRHIKKRIMRTLRALAPMGLVIVGISSEVLGTSIEKKKESPWSLYIASDLGYSRIQTDVFTEASKNGFQMSPQLLASFQWGAAVIDAGGGWIWNRSSGSRDVITEDTITSYGFLSHLAVRYAWHGHQWGLLNENAVADNFNFGGNTSPTSVASFVGPQYLYQWEALGLRWRAGLSALTDLTISHRQVYLALAHVQLGLPIPPISNATVPDDSSSIQKRLPLIDSFALVKNHFEVASATLTKEAEGRFHKMAIFFLENSSEWSELHFSGHADQRGSRAFNLRLSKQRAENVMNIFRARGLSIHRLKSIGFGADRPLQEASNEEAWSENRRVEIEVHGPLSPPFIRKISAMIESLDRH